MSVSCGRSRPTNMTNFGLRDWEIEVDAEETAQVQRSRISGSPEACECLPCKNFVAVRHAAYPAEFLELLERLGVPADRESEILPLRTG